MYFWINTYDVLELVLYSSWYLEIVYYLNLFKIIGICQYVIYSQNITKFRFWAGLSNWRKLPVIDLQSVFPVWDAQQEASANQKPLSWGGGQWEASSETGGWPHFHQILFTTQCFIPPWSPPGRQPTIPPIPQHNNKEHEDSQEHSSRHSLGCGCGTQTIPGILSIFNVLCSDHFLLKYLTFRRTLSLLTLFSFSVCVPYPLKEIKVTGPVSDLPPPPSPGSCLSSEVS